MRMANSAKLIQPRNGYRYSIDPFLLVDNVIGGNARRIVDLGTGNGILPLLLSKLFPNALCWGLDIQREPLVCAVKNCAKPGVKARFIQSDIRQASSLLKAESFDLAVSNPPYRKQGSGRLNRVSAKAIARHEISLTLNELASGAAHLLKDGGLFYLIHLAQRYREVLDTLKENSLTPDTVRFLHNKSGEDPFWVIVRSIKNGSPPGGQQITVKKPFTVYSDDGEYSREMNRIYEKFDI